MRVALLALLAACRVDGTFQCTIDADCDGATGGTCEATKRCAFPDTACSTPRRYDDSAGELAGQCVAAKTCAEAAVDDGDVQLAWGGDTDKLWTASCADGFEYLALPAGGAANFSQYTAGGKSPGDSVRTTFDRVRLDVAKNAIDIADQRFSSSSGGLKHSGTTDVSSMPYAVAMDCAGSGSTTGVGAVDLTGTPFLVSQQFASGGVSDSGSIDRSTDQGLTIKGGGNCGWEAPSNTPSNPFNQLAASPILSLAYVGLK